MEFRAQRPSLRKYFGGVLVPTPSAVHRRSLSTRMRCWTGHGPGVPPRAGVTSPESPPSASVSPFPSVLRNSDQCDTEQLDVIKSPKELVRPHPCFRKPRSHQMPPGSSAWHRATEGEETVPSLFHWFPIVLCPALISSLLEHFAMGPEGNKCSCANFTSCHGCSKQHVGSGQGLPQTHSLAQQPHCQSQLAVWYQPESSFCSND